MEQMCQAQTNGRVHSQTYRTSRINRSRRKYRAANLEWFEAFPAIGIGVGSRELRVSYVSELSCSRRRFGAYYGTVPYDGSKPEVKVE